MPFSMQFWKWESLVLLHLASFHQCGYLRILDITSQNFHCGIRNSNLAQRTNFKVYPCPGKECRWMHRLQDEHGRWRWWVASGERGFTGGRRYSVCWNLDLAVLQSCHDDRVAFCAVASGTWCRGLSDRIATTLTNELTLTSRSADREYISILIKFSRCDCEYLICQHKYVIWVFVCIFFSTALPRALPTLKMNSASNIENLRKAK